MSTSNGYNGASTGANSTTSSGLAYTPYHSKRHSRGSSLRNALPAEFQQGVAASSGNAAASSSAQTPASEPKDKAPNEQPNGGTTLRRLSVQPTQKHLLPAANVAKGSPPPLRRISEIRNASGSAGDKGKGKGVAASESHSELNGVDKRKKASRDSEHSSPLTSTSSSRAPTPSSPASSTSSRLANERDTGSASHQRSRSTVSSASTPYPLSLPPTNLNAHPASSSLYTSLVQDPIPIPAGPALANHEGDGDTSFEYPQGFSDSGRPAAPGFRRGFQARGVRRIRTDEFEEARRRIRSGEDRRKADLMEERLARRLEKLLSIHVHAAEAVRAEAAVKEQAKRDANNAARALPFERANEDSGSTRSSVRDVAGSVWSNLRSRAMEAASSFEDPEKAYMRRKEREIVHWEDDKAIKKCPICSTSFSLAVRKHHCRLCGRVVCASPQLTRFGPMESAGKGQMGGAETDQKCSGLILADPDTMRISSAFVLNRDEEAVAAEQSKSANGSVKHTQSIRNDHVQIRICRDCRDTVCRKQYMLEESKVPTYLKLYEALMRLQKEIEEGLPEFQEMVLGLQKQDASATLGVNDNLSLESDANRQQQQAHARVLLALQKDAASARKQLLANFANYDALARRIKNLPPDRDGAPEANVGMQNRAKQKAGSAEGAQERLQQAIFTRANLFLQQNMFPLQSLPKLGQKKDGSDGTASPSGSMSGDHPHADSKPNGTNDSSRAALQHQLSVLLEQEELVSSYVESASQARKFDDAKSLRGSLDELKREIAATRKKLAAHG